jgi:hypothetical protein
MSVIKIQTASLPGRPKLPSFREYKEDILSFQMEEYLKNKMETKKIEMLSGFLEIYRTIEEEDMKKPIFSMTTKFKKFPNHLKYYKYVKFSREEEKKGWSSKKPVSEVDKIIYFLKSQFNKMSEDNFAQVQQEILDELETYDHPDLFQILSKEIYQKCIQDSKYRHLYLQFVASLWQNKPVHLQRFDIIDLESDFYVKFKYVEQDHGLIELVNEEGMIGPFSSDNAAYMEAWKLMNFKRYFIQFLEDTFKNKDIKFSMELCDDSTFFEKKRQILGFSDIMFILFQEKYIHMDILHIMILHFLHVNHESFEMFEEIEIEAVYQIMKSLYEGAHIQKAKYPIFDFYVNTFDGILANKSVQPITKRIEFFIKEMKGWIESPLTTPKEVIKEISLKDLVQQMKRSLTDQDMDIWRGLVEKQVNEKNKSQVSEYIMMYILEQKDIRKDWVQQWRNIGEKSVIEKIIANMGDLSLDIGNLHKKMLSVIENIDWEEKEEWRKKIFAEIQSSLFEGEYNADSEAESEDDWMERS